MHKLDRLTMLRNVNVFENKGPKTTKDEFLVLVDLAVWSSLLVLDGVWAIAKTRITF